MQVGLFPLRIDSIQQANTGGRDLRTVAITSDRHDYAIKHASDGHGIPGSEFLGYRMAQACQIATPHSAILQDPATGELYFGCRWEHTAATFATKSAADRQAIITSCGPTLSRTLALDIFAGNVDRHFGNWLYTPNGQGQWTAMAIDFARALLARRFPADPFPMTPCATLTSIQVLKTVGAWDGPAAVFALSRLGEVRATDLQHWLTECPAQWIDTNERAALVAWWGSEAYHTRLQACMNSL